MRYVAMQRSLATGHDAHLHLGLGGRWLELSGVEATAERTGMSYSIYDPVKDFTLKISDTPLADDAIQVAFPFALPVRPHCHWDCLTQHPHPSTHSLPRGGGVGRCRWMWARTTAC